MSFTVNGNSDEFFIKNESSILALKLDETGNQTGERKVHVITDSNENQDDRILVIQKLKEFRNN